jgi:hypothetical protein
MRNFPIKCRHPASGSDSYLASEAHLLFRVSAWTFAIAIIFV